MANPGRGDRRRGVGTMDDFETTKGVDPIESFEDMGLKEDVLRGLYEYGYEKPSAIQQRAIMPILQGRDVIAQAQSGTGKTSMIALSVCQVVDTSSREYVFSSSYPNSNFNFSAKLSPNLFSSYLLVFLIAGFRP